MTMLCQNCAKEIETDDAHVHYPPEPSPSYYTCARADWPALYAESQRQLQALQEECAAAVEQAREREAEAAALRKTLEKVQERHWHMDHHEDCPARGHKNTACQCPDSAKDNDSCVDGVCECCLSVDIINAALSTDAGKPLLDRLERYEALIRKLEWSGRGPVDFKVCPLCQFTKEHGHGNQCDLNALTGVTK